MNNYKRNFLKQIDIFGVETCLKYQDFKKFTSQFGGLVTLIIIGVLCYLFSLQVIQISQGKLPYISIEQSQIKETNKYQIETENFVFGIGLLKNGQEPFIDEHIFSIEAKLYTKQFSEQSDNSNETTIENNIQLEICSKVDLDKMNIKSSLFSTFYSKFYCLSNTDNLILENIINKSTEIRFIVKECVDTQKCTSLSTRKQILQNTQVFVQISNPLLSLQDYNEPFQKSEKTLKYQIPYDFLADISLIYSKTQVIDNEGFVYVQQASKENIILGRDFLQLANKQNDQLLSISLQIDSQKEIKYYRSYLTISQMLAFLGGFFNILYFLGGLILKPYNSQQFEETLISDINQLEKGNKNKSKEQNNYLIKNNNTDISKVTNTVKNKKQKKEINLKVDVQNNKQQYQERSISLFDKIKLILINVLGCYFCFSNDIQIKQQTLKNVMREYTNIVFYINKFKKLERMRIKYKEHVKNLKQDKLDATENLQSDQNHDAKQLYTPSIGATNHDRLIEDLSQLNESRAPNQFQYDYIEQNENPENKDQDFKSKRPQKINIPLKEQVQQFQHYRQRAYSAQKVQSQNSSTQKVLFKKVSLQKVELDYKPFSHFSQSVKNISEPKSALITRQKQKSIQSNNLPFGYLSNEFDFKYISPLRQQKPKTPKKESYKNEIPSETETPLAIYQPMSPIFFDRKNDSINCSINKQFLSYSKTSR